MKPGNENPDQAAMWFIAATRQLLVLTGCPDASLPVTVAERMEHIARDLPDAQAASARRAARWMRNLLAERA